MTPEIVPAHGWQKCARLANEVAEVLVSLDVGPRVLGYKLRGGEDVLRVFPEQMGTADESEYVVRGGHRLWVSPETDRTYAPDNAPVEWQAVENGISLVNPAAAPWQVRKELTVTLAQESSAVTLRHELKNQGAEPTELAPWALTIMRPGGVHLIPQPPLGEHGPDAFLPERIIVPWTYTDLSDPRWKLGRRFWTLTPKDGTPATKLGFLHTSGWVAYLLPDALFLKTVELVPGAQYPDLGCNYETFSKSDFLELETLGPLQRLEPGESAVHTERWHLFGDAGAPDTLDETALESWLQPFLAKAGLS